MLELVKGCHKRTGLTETVPIISISGCTNSTISIGNLGTSRNYLVYPEFLVNPLTVVSAYMRKAEGPSQNNL